MVIADGAPQHENSEWSSPPGGIGLRGAALEMFLAWLLLTIDPIPDIESSVAE